MLRVVKLRKFKRVHNELRDTIQDNFLLEPCLNCKGELYRLLEIYSSGHVARCECISCDRKVSFEVGKQLLGNPYYDYVEYSNLDYSVNERGALNFFPFTWINAMTRYRYNFLLQSTPARLAYQSNDRVSIPSKVKQIVMTRDGGACVACGSDGNLQYDHIIPVSRGGNSTADNLQILCSQCNQRKFNKIL